MRVDDLGDRIESTPMVELRRKIDVAAISKKLRQAETSLHLAVFSKDLRATTGCLFVFPPTAAPSAGIDRVFLGKLRNDG